MHGGNFGQVKVDDTASSKGRDLDDTLNHLHTYCNALKTKPPNETVQTYFADPTCNAYYEDKDDGYKICVNSVFGTNVYDQFSNNNSRTLAEVGIPYCYCNSLSAKYPTPKESFVGSLRDARLKRDGGGKCPTTNVNIQNVVCKQIIKAAGNINIEKGSTVANQCSAQIKNQKAQSKDCSTWPSCPAGQILKQNAASITSPSNDMCCTKKTDSDAKMCDAFTCPTGQSLKKNKELIPGADANTCCEKTKTVMCDAFTGCNDVHKNLVMNAKIKPGNTVSECCADRTCPGCSLNGQCIDGKCTCKSGFSGEKCEKRDILSRIKLFVEKHKVITLTAGVVLLLILALLAFVHL